MTKALIISGELGRIVARQKSGKPVEIGELLVTEDSNQKIILEVIDLVFGSQISQQNLELMSGIKLEQDINEDLELLDPELRTYTLAILKPVLQVSNNNAVLCKTLPAFFSEARELTKEDLTFLSKPDNSMCFGKIRSGSKMLDVDVNLPGDQVFSHHIMIAGTTGRGKSVLMSNLLWNTIDKDYCGILVLDPHDEYYGRTKFGLKDHPMKENVRYYTHNEVPVGCSTLKINLRTLKPHHFDGAITFSDAQKQALASYYKRYGDTWIQSIILDKPLEVDFYEATLAVIKRRLLNVLDLEFAENQLFCNGVFTLNAGEMIVSDICSELETGKKVVIDTSSFSGAVEILIGSLITSEIFNRYKKYKSQGRLSEKPVISIVLEEAPRVLGKEVLEEGPNIFATIAREGRKFRIGLTAITQLPSLIPRQILANMNTKIILGIEMAAERQAIIDSASQDLSAANRTIASLDKGEAIISSNFSKFAIPVKIPLFDKSILQKKGQSNLSFGGIKL
ncbi:MAG: ATP-binding protein [Candidatus Woesearchaeota archaeon]